MLGDSRDKGNGSLGIFFGLTFGFSWLFWGIGLLASRGAFSLPFPALVLVVLGANGPLAAAFALTYRQGGWQAVKDLLRAAFDVRMKPVWWLLILLIPPVLEGLAVWLNVVQSGFQPDRALLSQPLLILPTFLMMFFLGGGQEEFGWRGYALPRLLAKWSPLAASLILGALWGVWHLPLFYITGVSQSFMPFWVFLLLAMAFSVLFTWLYLKTGRSLFSALLLHTAINTSMSIFPPIEMAAGGNQMALTYLMLAYAFVALVLVMTDRGTWFGTYSADPSGSREARQATK